MDKDKKILIIEDEAAIQKILSEPLAFAGYRITTASDGLEGINAFHEQDFDLILLDIMLPKIDGYTVCEMIRQESQIPIILLTALDAEDDQIKGFDKLADDYITKPFSIKLVSKRVEALLRRASSDAVSDCIRYKEIILNETERKVTAFGNEVTLTRLEFEILLLFLKNTGRVFTRDDLLNLVWGYDFAGDYVREDIPIESAGLTVQFYYARKHQPLMEESDAAGAIRKVVEYCTGHIGPLSFYDGDAVKLIERRISDGGYAGYGASLANERDFTAQNMNDEAKGGTPEQVMIHELFHSKIGETAHGGRRHPRSASPRFLYYPGLMLRYSVISRG